MTLVCKNICLKPEYEHRKVVRNLAETPYKKCAKCCLFIKYEGIWCPCCGVKLSKRAKNTIARRRRLEWDVRLVKKLNVLGSLVTVGLHDNNVQFVIMAWLDFQENLISNQQGLISMTKRFHVCAKCTDLPSWIKWNKEKGKYEIISS